MNTVVGFIGPEYLFDGKQIMRAGLEDHFCGKLLGLPMGCDVCYTNHAEADQDDMDALLTVLGAAGCNYIMGVPGADDIMLNYQSTSFHDALYLKVGAEAAPGAGIRGVARTNGNSGRRPTLASETRPTRPVRPRHRSRAVNTRRRRASQAAENQQPLADARGSETVVCIRRRVLSRDRKEIIVIDFLNSMFSPCACRAPLKKSAVRRYSFTDAQPIGPPGQAHNFPRSD